MLPYREKIKLFIKTAKTKLTKLTDTYIISQIKLIVLIGLELIMMLLLCRFMLILILSSIRLFTTMENLSHLIVIIRVALLAQFIPLKTRRSLAPS